MESSNFQLRQIISRFDGSRTSAKPILEVLARKGKDFTCNHSSSSVKADLAMHEMTHSSDLAKHEMAYGIDGRLIKLTKIEHTLSADNVTVELQADAIGSFMANAQISAVSIKLSAIGDIDRSRWKKVLDRSQVINAIKIAISSKRAVSQVSARGLLLWLCGCNNNESKAKEYAYEIGISGMIWNR